MALESADVAPVAAATFNNVSSWANFSSSLTRYAPSLDDLLLAGPRLLTRIGSIISFPEAVDSFGQRVIPDPTGDSTYFVATTATELAADISSAVVNTVHVLEDGQDPASMVPSFTMESSAKGLGSVFSYATSKWAFSCIIMAIVLNRTHIFAASRRRIRLVWPIRLLLRAVPILLLAYHSPRLLQAIQCQTSPDFAEMRWGNASKSSDLMFAEPNGYLHGLSSTLLFGASDYDSCRAIDMVPVNSNEFSNELRGSLSQLWPLFQIVSLSYFLETVSCALQGRHIAMTTSISLFEQSLAFAEADVAIGNQLGWGVFSTGNSTNVTFQRASGVNIAISRSMIMKRVNTPPQVLLIAFLSSMSHITSHALGIFNLQTRYRLLSTGFWAICFMGSLLVEAVKFIDDPSHLGFFRFPTVCIISLVPHLMVLAGIVMCFTIYAFALILAAMEPLDPNAEGPPLTFGGRIRRAHENMQANISLADIRISRAMNFYTALQRTGFAILTMASEAVYLHEDRNVNVKERTWLEEERLREFEALRMQWTGTGIIGDPRYDSVGTIGLVPIKHGQAGAASGYARERAAQNVPKSRLGDRHPRDGVGAAERSSRWILALEFLMNINRLATRWCCLVLIKLLTRMGVRQQSWAVSYLNRWISRRKRGDEKSKSPSETRAKHGRNRNRSLFNDATIDVEAEERRRLQRSLDTASVPEEVLDSRLYDSWKHGELWGAVDTSGDWKPNQDDDDEWDATSVVSDVNEDERTTDDQWEDDGEIGDEEAEGQRTPTQHTFTFSRESTPSDQLIGMADLARLLHPRSPDEREEAHTLAAHLNSDRIITRSQYARIQRTQKGLLLLPNENVRRRPNQGRMTDEEQAELLEQLIIFRRSAQADDHARYNPDEDSGPKCVVCQAAPRKIIVWPCRCLSLCDECRVSLAMNNFDKCVCCRREVISFSRIWVP